MSTDHLPEVPRAAAGGSTLRRIAEFWPVWVGLGVSLMVGLLLQSAHHSRSVAAQKRQLELQAQSMRDRLQTQGALTFSPTTGLATLVQVDGTLSRERFERLIERSRTLVPFIRSVVASPDDIARYVYPLQGNERVVNLDYRSVPAQWAQIQQAKEQKAPRLFAPVKLVQGGTGVIQRTPVFVRANAAAPEQYWGVLSVVADLESFIAASGVAQDAQLEVALFSDAALTTPAALIWGQWSSGAEAGVTAAVDLPGAQWVLRVRPRSGWSDAGAAPEALAVWTGGGLVSLLLGLLVRQSQRLRRGNRELSREMTRTRSVQSALESSQAESLAARDRLQAVLDAATEVAIISTDLEGRVTVFNRGAEHMLGYTAQEVMGKSPGLWHVGSEISAAAQALHRPPAAAPSGFEVFARLAQDAEPRTWTYVTKDARNLPVSLALSTVRATDGTALGFLGIARDLSAQKRAEAELRQLTEELESRVEERTEALRAAMQTLQQAQEGLARAEKLAALGSLVAGVAHELNTPIGNCLITASTLQEHTRTIHTAAADGTMRKSAFDAYLNDMHQGADILLRGLTNAAELVQHFKQLAVDQTSEQRRTFLLGSVVEDVVSLSKAAWKGTAHQIEIAVEMPTPLDSYPGALGRVLSNLMQNALLHGLDGVDQGRFRVWAREMDANTIEVRVEDNGAGMTEEVRRRAFDPFFTTKLGKGGSGLGLNIVYNTVTGVLGGTIEVHSRPGGGTQFVLRLPYKAPSFTPAASP